MFNAHVFCVVQELTHTSFCAGHYVVQIISLKWVVAYEPG